MEVGGWLGRGCRAVGRVEHGEAGNGQVLDSGDVRGYVGVDAFLFSVLRFKGGGSSGL